MNKIFLCLLAIIITTNISMAESYYCEGNDNSGRHYNFEYNPSENECKFFLYTGNIKTDPAVDFLMKTAGIKIRQDAEQQVLKHYQEQYNSCMKDRQIAADAYRKGQCKKLEIKRYTVGSKKCEDKYLNGNKIFSSCFD